MANQYRFLPDFSVFENDEQNDVSTEDTNSSIMSRNRQVDTDASGTGGDFLERFYQNLRSAFNDDDKFKQTFMSKKRPKPDISELRSYVDRVKGSSDIEDALLEATGMYNPGMASDDSSMSIKDASDGITVPKQPDILVDELSSNAGSYLRNRANKGASFVGEGVQMASAGSLSVEDMDLARMMAGQTMRKEAAKMGLPVVDMEEEERKALEYAKTIPKLSTLKGEGLMSPVSSDPRVDMAASGLNEDDPLGRVRPKARPEVETAETAEAMGSPMEQPFVQRKPFTFNKNDAMNFAANNFDDDTLRAAFVATVEAETGYDNRVEDNYTVDRAIAKFVTANANKDGTLGPKMTARKAALEALDQSEDNEKLEEQIFNIVYGNRSDLGNDQEGDGFKYRGRGPIQLTGKDNYKRVGDAIGVDLVKNPDLVVNDKDIGLRAVKAYFDLKGFSRVNSAAGLARVVGHADDKASTEANRRWNKVKGLKKQFGQFNVRPSARPDTRVASN